MKIIELTDAASIATLLDALGVDPEQAPSERIRSLRMAVDEDSIKVSVNHHAWSPGIGGPSKTTDNYADVFYMDEQTCKATLRDADSDVTEAGWYWRPYHSTGGEPNGPFRSARSARADARQWFEQTRDEPANPNG